MKNIANYLDEFIEEETLYESIRTKQQKRIKNEKNKNKNKK